MNRIVFAMRTAQKSLACAAFSQRRFDAVVCLLIEN
jgi:hypothetical protein